MNNEADEHAHTDPYENIDRSIVGSLQLQLITDAYIGFLSDQTAIFLRLDYREGPDADVLTRTQFALTPKQAKWFGQRLQYWGNELSPD